MTYKIIKREKKTWKRKEINFIILARECKFPLKQIARYFRVTENAIRKVLQRSKEKILNKKAIHNTYHNSFYYPHKLDEAIRWYSKIVKEKISIIKGKNKTEYKVQNGSVLTQGQLMYKINKKRLELSMLTFKIF